MNHLMNKLGWLLFSLLGASALAVIALNRGERSELAEAGARLM